jgi:hypothetical protein
MKCERARVYRFRDDVAITIGDGTCYVSPSMAREIAGALKQYANDVDETKFTESRLSGTEITEIDNGR